MATKLDSVSTLQADFGQTRFGEPRSGGKARRPQPRPAHGRTLGGASAVAPSCDGAAAPPGVTVGHRVATAQAGPSRPSGGGGRSPGRRAKRGYPPMSLRSAEVEPEGRQVAASSSEGEAPSAALVADQGEACPHGWVAALRAAPPQAARSAALEPVGREVIDRMTGAASSRDSVGAAALAAVPQARPARWQAGDESTRSGRRRIVFAIVLTVVSTER